MTPATPKRPAAETERRLAPLEEVLLEAVLVLVEVPFASLPEAPPEPAALVPVTAPPSVVLLEVEWLARVWKAAKVLLTFGLMANTIPFWQ